MFDHHDHLFGSLNESEPREEFDRLVSLIRATGEAQDELRAHAKGLTIQKNALRESLFIDHLHPVVSVMQMNRSLMLNISALSVPERHDTDHEVEMCARSAASLANSHRGQFVACGLPPNFVEEMLAAADEFQRLRAQCSFVRVQRHSHTYAIEYHIARAWVVYRALKALGRKALRQHPEVLAELRHAKLHRPRRALPAPARLALRAGEPANEVSGHDTNSRRSAATEGPVPRTTSILALVKGLLNPGA